MLRSTSQSYICWRCLSGRGSLKPRRCSSLVRSSSQRGFARLGQLRERSRASTEESKGQYDDQFGPRSLNAESYIRAQLRAWEAANKVDIMVERPPEISLPKRVLNPSEQGTREANLIQDADENSDAYPLVEGDDIVETAGSAAGLTAGDLVEVSSRISTSEPDLAVCLGKFNGLYHFYTSVGKWYAAPTTSTRFIVRNFIQDPADLEPVIQALPSTSDTSDVLRLMRDLRVGPSRSAGGNLINQMVDFRNASREIYQGHLESLDKAHVLLGPDAKVMTLAEIAAVLLPASLKRQSSHYSPEELYAVHAALCADTVGFVPLDRVGHCEDSCPFLVNSHADIARVGAVEQVVRLYLEPNRVFTDEKNPRFVKGITADFQAFLLKAREAIDQSRKSRDWTPHGMLGPSKGKSPSPFSNWKQSDLMIIQYMHHWAVSGRFNVATPLHWVGSVILRAIDRYSEAPTLDATVGWTFLQEIGWIAPWELHSRHALSLPGVQPQRGGGLLPLPGDEKEIILQTDQLKFLRRDFAGSTVYCIDSESTADVDDGVSIEPTADGDHWIHIHVADPASRIQPDIWQAERARLLTQSIYLAGYQEPMFQDHIVREAFSLAPDRPSLTFSAKVTESGNIVEYQITPGIVRDVVYITPENISTITEEDNDPFQSPYDIFEVGTPPKSQALPTRKMTPPQGLTPAQRREIRKLGKLASALHEVRLQNGASPAYPPRLAVDVSFEGVRVARRPSDGFVESQGDPYIRLSYGQGSGNLLVSSLMQLAGQVAARWCHDRNIPIPYRVQTLAKKNRRALQHFTRKVLYPQLLAGKIPSDEDYHTLYSLAGETRNSTTPGYNFSMGLDMYTKTTSPLRRYSDLLVHWQIEAALLEEHRRGTSLAKKHSGSSAVAKRLTAKEETTVLDSLPFSRHDLEHRIFPHLQIRERHAKLTANVDGIKEWAFQALFRAWRFGQGVQHLPKTFRLTVKHVFAPAIVTGQIDWFDRYVYMDAEHLGTVAHMSDIKPGDVFTVELADMNVYEMTIHVRALERLTRAPDVTTVLKEPVEEFKRATQESKEAEGWEGATEQWEETVKKTKGFTDSKAKQTTEKSKKTQGSKKTRWSKRATKDQKDASASVD